MRLGRRAPSSPTATPGASLPLRAQALVPFALALALVVAFAAVGAALVARSAVDRELGAQAETARHLVVGQLETTRQRLSAEVAELGDGQARGSGRPLEERLMAFSRREKLTLAAVIDDGGAPVGDGRLAWARLPFARALAEQARRAGKPVSGSGRSRQDEPFVLAVARGRSGRTFVVGRSVDRRHAHRGRAGDRRARAPRDRRRRPRGRAEGHGRVRVAAAARGRLPLARAGGGRRGRAPRRDAVEPAARRRRRRADRLRPDARALQAAAPLRRAAPSRGCAPRCSRSRAGTTPRA